MKVYKLASSVFVISSAILMSPIFGSTDGAIWAAVLAVVFAIWDMNNGVKK